MMNAALQATLEFLKLYWAPLLCGVAVVAILPLVVGYIVLVERKIMADMQTRLWAMRVGPHGLLQPISAAGMALVSALLFTGTLNIKSIVEAQSKEGIWFVLLAPVAFFTYLVASIAETNRAPFDLPEAESELVAGYMTEFSGFRWSLYFLAEYTNMIVVASVATTLFLGGWLRPFSGVPWLNFLDFVPPLLLSAVGAYCVLRMPKQLTRVQQLFMLAVAGLCFFVVLVRAGAGVMPVVTTSTRARAQ